MWRIRDSEGIREWVLVVVIGKQGQVAGMAVAVLVIFQVLYTPILVV